MENDEFNLDNVTFICLLVRKGDETLMKIMPNGDIFIRGELITTDKEIADAFTTPIIKPEQNG